MDSDDEALTLFAVVAFKHTDMDTHQKNLHQLKQYIVYFEFIYSVGYGVSLLPKNTKEWSHEFILSKRVILSFNPLHPQQIHFLLTQKNVVINPPPKSSL